MILIILISLLLGLMLWILWGPVIIFADTENNRYYLKLPGILKASVVPAEVLFTLKIGQNQIDFLKMT